MPEDKKIRLFIAIELPLKIQKVLENIQQILKKTNLGIKWVKPDNIHLTLKFLGYVQNSQIEPIKDKMNLALEGFKPFNITLAKNVGTFPGISYPRVIWVGINEGENKLISLEKKLEDKMENIGFKKEKREFTPHLTLARIKSLKSKEVLVSQIKKTHLKKNHSFKVMKICLFQSILMIKGPVYKILHQVPL